jgi:hypothetical protein
MVRNPKRLRQFRDALSKSQGPLTFSHSLKIFTSMWKEGMALGILPLDNPLEGIETDIRIASVLNSCLKNSYRE